MGFFDWLRRRGKRLERARPLYEALVAQARWPDFFRGAGLPDSVDGRFESIVLHLFLLLHRLKGQGSEAAERSQALFDLFCLDMDRSLREMGAGDLGVGPRVKRMAKGFYGRTAAYDAALARDDDGALIDALRRNAYGTVGDPDPAALASLAGYLRRAVGELRDQSLDRLLAGHIDFPRPPLRAPAAVIGD
jgi:cytochrome b pre-mRNA-processing protein 3